MGQKQRITLTAPAYWATALVNNDYSGLQSPDAIEDLVALYRFLKRERPLEIIDVKRNRRGEGLIPRLFIL